MGNARLMRHMLGLYTFLVFEDSVVIGFYEGVIKAFVRGRFDKTKLIYDKQTTIKSKERLRPAKIDNKRFWYIEGTLVVIMNTDLLIERKVRLASILSRKGHNPPSVSSANNGDLILGPLQLDALATNKCGLCLYSLTEPQAYPLFYELQYSEAEMFRTTDAEVLFIKVLDRVGGYSPNLWVTCVLFKVRVLRSTAQVSREVMWRSQASFMKVIVVLYLLAMRMWENNSYVFELTNTRTKKKLRREGVYVQQLNDDNPEDNWWKRSSVLTKKSVNNRTSFVFQSGLRAKHEKCLEEMQIGTVIGPVVSPCRQKAWVIADSQSNPWLKEFNVIGRENELEAEHMADVVIRTDWVDRGESLEEDDDDFIHRP